MRYSEVLQSLRAEADGRFVAEVPADWMQGRSVFGGLQAALALNAMRALVPAELPLRTLQVTFMAPVPAGRVTVQAQVLRSGKNTVHAEARLVGEGQVQCLAVGIFGAGRPSVVAVTPPQQTVSCERPIEFRFVPGRTPDFTQHCPMRWLRGTPPFTGGTQTAAVIEVDLNDEGTAGEAQVLAIADAIPPIALSLLRTPAAGSSMTWTMEFLGHPFTHLPLRRWRLDCEVVAARDGYTSQSVMVWGPDGVPVALSRQNMVVFG